MAEQSQQIQKQTRYSVYSKEVETSSISSAAFCDQEGRIDRIVNTTGLLKMKHNTQGVDFSIIGPKGNVRVNDPPTSD